MFIQRGIDNRPIEERERDSIVPDWDRILIEADMDARGAKINEFIQRYAMNPSDTAQRYLEKAQKELIRIADEKEARKDWIDAKQDNTILGYVDFITKYPYSEYREEADRLIQEMKGDILTDMKKVPFKYCRERAYEYISSGLFTEDELTGKYHLLTGRAYQYILKYPKLRHEQENLPLSIMNPENQIIHGNVDVLFLGVSGSGGKTCMMASLMSLVGESSDFLYQEYNDNKECDNIYGSYLADYMKSNRLPPATDTCYIQVVNTLIKCEDEYKGVSFIEFAGEQVCLLASNSAEEGLSDGGISPSLIRILNNRNNKIIFLTLDPTAIRNIALSSYLWVTQADVLSCVISHFKNSPQFMRNVIGLHTIISKSDTWLEGSLSSSIKQAVESADASGLFLQIDRLCKTYNLNTHINCGANPIPFSIGKFMMGNTYEFDDGDARKILDIIKSDIIAMASDVSRLKKFAIKIQNYFNN